MIYLPDSLLFPLDAELKKIEVYENQNKKFKMYSEAEGEGNVSSKVLNELIISLAGIFNYEAVRECHSEAWAEESQILTNLYLLDSSLRSDAVLNEVKEWQKRF